MSGFVHFHSSRGGSWPDQRITRIGDEPVKYASTFWHGHEIPSSCVISVGDKLVEYGTSWSTINRITHIGSELVEYSPWNTMIKIGDKPVKYNFWNNYIISIGDKRIEYSAYPKDYHNEYRQRVINVSILGIIIIGAIAIKYFHLE